MIFKLECKNRKLYRIHSRNLCFGVYREETGGFIGLREKFGSVYLFEEYHYDNGPPFGTVKPEEELPEELPQRIVAEVSLGSECQRCGKSCKYEIFPDKKSREKKLKYGGTILVPGEWKHLEDTGCVEVFPMERGNPRLYEWLYAMEKKYKDKVK